MSRIIGLIADISTFTQRMTEMDRKPPIKFRSISRRECEQIYAEYNMGSSQADICRRHMLSRTTVGRVIYAANMGLLAPDEDILKIIYVGIAEYLEKNKLSVSEFSNMCGIPRATFWRIASGNAKRGPTKELIDKVLFGSGMTYERAFGRVRKRDDAGTQG